MRSLITDHL